MGKAPAPDTVIFDLDGTLVDTELAAAKAINETFAQWGIRISAEDASYITGRTWELAAEHLATRYPLPMPAPDATEVMIGAYRQALKTDLTIVPGAAQAVTRLAQAGLPLGLVSGSRRQDIHTCLDRLGVRAHFKVVLGAEDYPRSKPAPDGYLKALKLLGVQDAKRAWVFEDSEAGIASALAAGCRVVAITGTNHFKQDNSRAHAAIPDLTPVTPEWLAQLSSRLS